VDGQVVLTQSVYLPEDPNCCSTGGIVQIWLRRDSYRLDRVERLPHRWSGPPTAALIRSGP